MKTILIYDFNRFQWKTYENKEIYEHITNAYSHGYINLKKYNPVLEKFLVNHNIDFKILDEDSRKNKF